MLSSTENGECQKFRVPKYYDVIGTFRQSYNDRHWWRLVRRLLAMMMGKGDKGLVKFLEQLLAHAQCYVSVYKIRLNKWKQKHLWFERRLTCRISASSWVSGDVIPGRGAGGVRWRLIRGHSSVWTCPLWSPWSSHQAAGNIALSLSRDLGLEEHVRNPFRSLRHLNRKERDHPRKE